MVEHAQMRNFFNNFSGKALVYAGFDPTSDGLHLGSMSILSVLKDISDMGHQVCAIIGTGTGRIGDPTGKTSARKFMDAESLTKNVEGLRRDISRVIPSALIIENDWFSDISINDFMINVMSHIPLSRLLGLSIVKDRLESGNGISLMESIYPVFQAWDMVVMSDKAQEAGLDMVIQVGGQDQTGNMATGLHLLGKIRDNRNAEILTIPLITMANGEKMGKSAGNALWLAPEKLDNISFFDGILSIPDEVLESSINILANGLSFSDDIVQRKFEFAKTVFIKARGKEALEGVLKAKSGHQDNMNKSDIGKDFQDTFVKSGLCKSRGEVLRMIKNSGIRVNGEKVIEPIDLKTGDIISCGKRQVLLS